MTVDTAEGLAQGRPREGSDVQCAGCTVAGKLIYIDIVMTNVTANNCVNLWTLRLSTQCSGTPPGGCASHFESPWSLNDCRLVLCDRTSQSPTVKGCITVVVITFSELIRLLK